MKNHQFAILSNNFATKIKELHTIHFLETGMQNFNPNQLLKSLLLKSFPNQKSKANKIIQLSNLMATNNQNAKEYLENNNPITSVMFYNVALQLLHFDIDEDFKLDHPLEIMKKSHLPYQNSNKTHLNNHDIIKNWYLLLNTHTKLGQTLLDDLAANGYFTQLNNLPHPLIFNGKAQPVFNTKKLQKEVVYVEAPLDTDNDGKRDLVKVELIRPEYTNNGLKVPTLYTASPYNQGTNDKSGERLTHNVDVKLKHKKANKIKYSDIEDHTNPTKDIPNPRNIKGHTKKAEETFNNEWSYTLNDYFLARGFAVVYSAEIGTKDSEGLRTTGDKAETFSTTAVIEWLTGNRTAFTNPSDNIAIDAWWSNGNIAMTGRSYLGTLQIAAASTGVKGLKTCIVEAAISSWYDYYRENGLVVAPGGFQGEDADVLAEETFSRKQRPGDYYRIQDKWKKELNKITKEQDRNTGNYNKFWDARNYIKDAKHIQSDMIFVHGLNDWNVKPKNVENIWKSLPDNIQKKLFLHQGPHIYINNFQSLDFNDMMNLWLTNKLLGINNHANELIPNVTIQDNVKPKTWNTYQNWAKNDHYHKYYLNQNRLDTENFNNKYLTFNDQLNNEQLNQYKRDYSNWYHDLLTNEDSRLNNHRLIFKTNPLNKDVYLDGNPQINLKISSNENVGMLSAMIVDYGKENRLTKTPQVIGMNAINEGYQWTTDHLKEFKLQKQPTSYKKITEGHMNLQNRHYNYQNDELQANQFYEVNLTLQPTFYHLLKGHQIGLIIYSTDIAMTTRGNQNINYTIDPKNSIIQLPFNE